MMKIQDGLRKGILIISAIFYHGSIEELPLREFIELVKNSHRRDIPIITGCDTNTQNVIEGSMNKNPESLRFWSVHISCKPIYCKEGQQIDVYN